MKSLALLLSLSLCAGATLSTSVLAQSVCASDGQPKPLRLMERFTNADCANCWRDPATAKAPPGTAVLDWVLPGSQGDDAPLSAVASRDATLRMEALKQAMPPNTAVHISKVAPDPGLKRSELRVARGLALSGYVGASIQLKPAPAKGKVTPVTAWLALVETLPVGLEGSPVERNLVRNVFQSTWNVDRKPPSSAQNQWFDQRSMGVADSVNPDRLKVIGWLADDQGRILALSQSACSVTP